MYSEDLWIRAVVGLRTKPATFFIGYHLHLSEWPIQKLRFQMRWCSENIFLNNWSQPVTTGMAIHHSVANDKIQAFKQLLEFWRPVLANTMRLVVILVNMILLLCHEMCKHLENSCNSLKHSFPHEQCLKSQNYTWTEGHVEGRGGP